MLINVPIDQIEDNPFQRRRDYGDVAELAADIARRGLLQTPRGRLLFDSSPVSAERLRATLDAVFGGWPGGQSFRVQLAFGHRRLRAYRALAANGAAAQYATIPVILEAMTDEQMLDAVWSENQHRRDISAIEQAELLSDKLERVRAAGGNQETVATEWGLDRSTIANKLRLLDLPAEVQEAVRDRRLSERQAQALIPVIRVAAVMREPKKLEWAGPEHVKSWLPMRPADYIAYATGHGDALSADDIREYRDKLVRHAGRNLPEVVATWKVEDPGVRQAQCKGCPARVDQHCVDHKCVTAKTAHIVEAIARRAAEDVGLPFSDDPAHFKPFHEWTAGRELRALYDAGVTDNLVVGGDVERGVKLYDDARPYLDGDGRGVARLGHRLGAIPQEEWDQVARARNAAAAEEAARTENTYPALALRDAWEKMTRAAERARGKRGRAAFEPLLDEASPALRRALWSLITEPSKREAEFDTAQLVGVLFSRTYALQLSDDDGWQKLLAACGLDPDAADNPDPVARLREACAEACHIYYRFDSEYSRRSGAPLVLEACDRLATWTQPLPDDIEVMAYWLERARPAAAGFVEPQTQPASEPEDIPTL